MSAKPADLKRPPVISVVAGAVAVIALVVVTLPWAYYSDADPRYGAIFTLLGIALMVLATGLLQWEWLWEALRGALFLGASWALLGDFLGHPLGPVASPVKTLVAIVVLALVLLLGKVPVTEYFEAQVKRSSGGRRLHPWSEGEALMIGGFFLGTAVVVGRLAASFLPHSASLFYGLSMPALAALAMWMVGCARVAHSKGYPEWAGAALALAGPAAYFVLAFLPLRAEKVPA